MPKPAATALRGICVYTFRRYAACVQYSLSCRYAAPRHMSHCLDLRKMAFDPAYSTSNQAVQSLRVLYDWMTMRSQCGGARASAGEAADAEPLNDLPDFDEVKAQWSTLVARLRMFHGDGRFSHWKGASGTVIMRDVYTKLEFSVSSMTGSLPFSTSFSTWPQSRCARQ